MFTFDPIAFSIGKFSIYWYGLMYLLSFVLTSFIMRYRIKIYKHYEVWSHKKIDDLLFYCIVGIVVGGRLGYVFLYQWVYYNQNMHEIFKIWHGGLSFHGGLIGVVLAALLFSYTNKKKFFSVTDFIAPVIPIGLFFGRWGNFMNGELWGRITTHRFGMIFTNAQDGLMRHPSQLYQMLTEGLILFICLWVYARKPRITSNISALFLLLYGSMRFFTEFFREPDVFLGLQMFGWTMGQILCIPMIVIGAAILFINEMLHIRFNTTHKTRLLNFFRKKNNNT
jgi:phosphatidylglycerol---prolipoprotein diacylglyceryl transferase